MTTFGRSSRGKLTSLKVDRLLPTRLASLGMTAFPAEIPLEVLDRRLRRTEIYGFWLALDPSQKAVRGRVRAKNGGASSQTRTKIRAMFKLGENWGRTTQGFHLLRGREVGGACD